MIKLIRSEAYICAIRSGSLTLCYCNDSRFFVRILFSSYQVLSNPLVFRSQDKTLDSVIEASLRLRTLRKRPNLGIGGCRASRFQAQAIQQGNIV